MTIPQEQTLSVDPTRHLQSVTAQRNQALDQAAAYEALLAELLPQKAEQNEQIEQLLTLNEALRTRNDDWQQSHQDSQQSYQEVRDALRERVTELENEQVALQSAYAELRASYDAVNSENTQLRININRLRTTG